MACNYDDGIRPAPIKLLLACRYEIVFKAISTCTIGLMGKKLSCTYDILQVRYQKFWPAHPTAHHNFGLHRFERISLSICKPSLHCHGNSAAANQRQSYEENDCAHSTLIERSQHIQHSFESSKLILKNADLQIQRRRFHCFFSIASSWPLSFWPMLHL